MLKNGRVGSTATRQRIVDAAVELFATEGGYAEVGVSRIAEQARITPGTFYYHFDSKEALAFAVIEQAGPKMWAVVHQHRPRQPGLESVIAMVFAISDLLKNDRLVWMGHHLSLGLAQLSEEARLRSLEGSMAFFDTVAEMIAEDDIRDDITREDMATQISMNLFGCHILSDRLRDSVANRLTRSWIALLRGAVPADKLPYFEQFVMRTAAQYG